MGPCPLPSQPPQEEGVGIASPHAGHGVGKALGQDRQSTDLLR